MDPSTQGLKSENLPLGQFFSKFVLQPNLSDYISYDCIEIEALKNRCCEGIRTPTSLSKVTCPSHLHIAAFAMTM